MTVELLLPMVKDRLNITWTDEVTDRRLKQVIEDAIPTLSGMVGLDYDAAQSTALGDGGEAFDFSAPSQERTLLVIYAAYLWEHQGHLFWANYREEIGACRQKRALAAIEAAKQEEADDGGEDPGEGV